uniref:Uncharacterized protein n=1 Tax=Acrobeloides nanus TaxID=290746 RepID=A0A914EIY7_9BILA
MLEVDKDRKGSKIRKALISTIPSANYYVPLLHVWLIIAVDVINIIKREVILNDLEINIPDSELEQKIKEYFDNKEIGTLKTQIEDIEAEMKPMHETDVVQIRNMLDVIDNGFEDEDEERELENDHVYKHEKGIVERADKQDGPYVHYLPYHAVVRKDKQTTKVRKVNDASASVANNPSLNKNLYKGPSKIPDAAGTLLCFRLPKKNFAQEEQNPINSLAPTTSVQSIQRLVVKPQKCGHCFTLVWLLA